MNRATAPVALTLLLVAATIPHALEDFRYGEFARFGISTTAAACALLFVYAAQIAGIVSAIRGSRTGLWLLAGCGLVWCVGAAVVHGPEIVASGPYRNGVESKALELAIIILGAAVAIVASNRAGR